MSTKHIRTTSDLARFGASLKIECGDCGAARTLPPFDACLAFGRAELTTLTARLKCKRCGAKGAKLTVLPPL